MKSNIFNCILLVAIVTLATGCNAISEELGDHFYQSRVAHQANVAWHAAYSCYCDLPNQSDFRRGFKDGYIATANGGTGCVPSIAPSHYWGSTLGCNKDQSCGRSWFQGYAHGIIAAEQDGAARSNQIMLSPAYQGNCQTNRSCEGNFEMGEPIMENNFDNNPDQGMTLPELLDEATQNSPSQK